MVAVWVELLLRARFDDGYYKGKLIKRGCAVYGREELAEVLGLTIQQVRTCIERLKSTNEITTESTSQYTIATIVKWEEYQGLLAEDNQQNNQIDNHQVTNEQPATNQRVTTSKKDKNDKKDKNNNIIRKTKHKYGVYKHVLLTDDEYRKLQKDFSNYQELITYLDEYIEMKGYVAKSHYMAIRKWVVDAVAREQRKKRNRSMPSWYSNPENETYQKATDEEIEEFKRMLEENNL